MKRNKKKFKKIKIESKKKEGGIQRERKEKVNKKEPNVTIKINVHIETIKKNV